MSGRLLGYGALLGLALVLTAFGASGFVRVRQLRGEIHALERDLANLRAENDRLAKTIDKLRNDPAYVEKLAREDLGLVREGETVLKFPSRR